jgi:hypothetical protein
MSNNAVNRPSGRAASRLKAVFCRAADYRRRARRVLTLALVSAGTAAAPSLALAQMGQTAMAPTGSVVNRAVNGFQNLNANGPGWLYYGVNAADRGLGYRGSYMTLGGFVPVAEDDLGGFWAADLRGHLSEFGGFFSNVGAVRKQFIGGTLLGVGVYWDYDGDQNQYSDTVIPVGLGNTYTFAGGHSYNQVGISGEWLTDYGNLRSNGYIPVGSTAQLVGPFLGNSLLCVNGVNAALGGADLEVGAYIPGLSDWAGMISVGGYALGNSRYSFPDGAAAVPWFGGVYTRLDMTFLNNWDFSLQANNDSYFDWTGFARLTYRMGASRRRNVPDQMEQPMMRNEHIVRAHQVPEVATNPADGSPWQVFHVDNTAEPGGTGSAESPFATIEEAVTRPTNDPYDIVYVHVGDSSATAPYITPVGGFTFGADNQYLIGEGSRITIPTELCGDRAFFAGSASSVYPFISNPGGAAIVMEQANVVVSHVGIVNSPIGITDGAGIASPGTATIQDVTIEGSGAVGQSGIRIANSSGQFTVDNVRLSNLSNNGLVLAAADGRVEMTRSTLSGITGTAIQVSGPSARAAVTNTRIADTKGFAMAATGDASAISLTSGTITDTTGDAVVASGASATVSISSSRILRTTGSGIVSTGPGGASVTVADSRLLGQNTGARLSGSSNRITLVKSAIRDSAANGIVMDGSQNTLTLLDQSEVRDSRLNGIAVEGTTQRVRIIDSRIKNSGGDGVSIATTASVAGPTIGTLLRSEVSNSTDVGVRVDGVDGPNDVMQIFGSSVVTSGLGGIASTNSNLDIGRDPTSTDGKRTRISDTGLFGIESVSTAGTQFVRVQEAGITAATDGIRVLGENAGTATNFIALQNSIAAPLAGNGILFDANGSTINADVVLNKSSTTNDLEIASADDPVNIRASGPLNLSNVNFGADILGVPGGFNYVPTLVVPPPPTPAP